MIGELIEVGLALSGEPAKSINLMDHYINPNPIVRVENNYRLPSARNLSTEVAAVGNGLNLEPYLGIRAGVIMPTGAKEQDYKPSLIAGVVGGINLFKVAGTRVGTRLGIYGFQSEDKTPVASIKTDSILSEFLVNFSPFTTKVVPYILAGPIMLSEFSDIKVPKYGVHDHPGSTTFGFKGGIELKVGEVGLEVSVIELFGENVRGAVSVMAGIDK
jgi:hypothetical protein